MNDEEIEAMAHWLVTEHKAELAKALEICGETGLVICQGKEKYIVGPYTGEESRVKLGACPAPDRRVGSFHTHPAGSLPGPSIDDYAAALRAGDELLCIGQKGQEPPIRCVKLNPESMTSGMLKILQEGEKEGQILDQTNEISNKLATEFRDQGQKTGAVRPLLWGEGQDIAREIDNGVRYEGPQYDEGKFHSHVFTDLDGTRSTFYCTDLEHCKKKLEDLRNFKAPAPDFKKRMTSQTGSGATYAQRKELVQRTRWSGWWDEDITQAEAGVKIRELREKHA